MTISRESGGFSPEVSEGKKLKRGLGNVELIAEEARLTQKEKLDKLEAIRAKATALAARILGQSYLDFAEDIVNDGYVKVVRFINNFRHDSSLETWFYRIVVNEALMFLRKEKRAVSMSVVEDPETREDSDMEFNKALDQSPNPEKVEINNQERLLLESALATLPRIYREAVLLTEYQGLTTQEAAARSEITEGAQKSRKKRGLDLLRKNLSKIRRPKK